MIYRFNQFQLDTDLYQLSDSAQPVQIEPLAFNLLAYLIEHQDRVVSRDELFEKLWPGKVVTDSSVSARLKDARKSVRDDGSQQSVIRTCHGRGYQFIADVEVISKKTASISEQLVQDSEFLRCQENHRLRCCRLRI